MNFFKSLNIKSIVIIVLGIALIISFFFGQKSRVNTHQDEIDRLHKNDLELLAKNDSLRAVNARIDATIIEINKKLADNVAVLETTQKELKELKNRRNETRNYVSHLSANGVANALTDHLNSTSPNTNR